MWVRASHGSRGHGLRGRRCLYCGSRATHFLNGIRSPTLEFMGERPAKRLLRELEDRTGGTPPKERIGERIVCPRG